MPIGLFHPPGTRQTGFQQALPVPWLAIALAGHDQNFGLKRIDLLSKDGLHRAGPAAWFRGSLKRKYNSIKKLIIYYLFFLVLYGVIETDQSGWLRLPAEQSLVGGQGVNNGTPPRRAGSFCIERFRLKVARENLEDNVGRDGAAMQWFEAIPLISKVRRLHCDSAEWSVMTLSCLMNLRPLDRRHCHCRRR
ncbi:MAG: hypothetical protein V4457_11970 [Pseudomonadota bacterium]